MNAKFWATLAAAALGVTALVGCSSGADPEPTAIGGDVIAPVTMSVNELQGASVELIVGQMLNINTDSLAVDSYSGEVSDGSVAEFTAGYVEGDAEFNPGVTALSEGTAEVTMTNAQGGIQPLEFTVVVGAGS